MLTLPSGLIWLASYPKSGNTWMRILLSNLFADTDQPENINTLSLRDGIASDRKTFEDDTLLDSHLLTVEEAEILRPTAHDDHAARSGGIFVKTHDAYTLLADGTPLLGRAAQGALYLVRDPRDVAVSFAFHQSMTMERAANFIGMPNAALRANEKQFRQRLSDWSGHVRSWLDQSDVPVHLIRYEDLKADTLGVFCAALDFLSISYEREAAARAVRHADFDELRRQERAQGFRESQEGQAAFFRAGRTGDWRRHLNETQVRKIETDHAAMMTRLSYERVTEEKTA